MAIMMIWEKGKKFELPLPMNQIQSHALQVTLRNMLAALAPYQGTYLLSDTVNGKPSWIMGSSAPGAIWYVHEHKSWHIGPKTHIGQNIASKTSGGPDNSSNTWKYYNENMKWIISGTNDVSVQCTDEKATAENEKWSPKKFTAFGRTFFDISIIQNNTIYKWIYVLALPDEAKSFQVNIKVKNATGEAVIDYVEKVKSVLECHDFIIENENCFALSVKKAKRDTNQVDYAIRIRNLKDEAKDEDVESGIDD